MTNKKTALDRRGSASPLPNDGAGSSRAGFVCTRSHATSPAGRRQRSSTLTVRDKATGDGVLCQQGMLSYAAAPDTAPARDYVHLSPRRATSVQGRANPASCANDAHPLLVFLSSGGEG